jgi:hypothetical protein
LTSLEILVAEHIKESVECFEYRDGLNDLTWNLATLANVKLGRWHRTCAAPNPCGKSEAERQGYKLAVIFFPEQRKSGRE